MIFDFPKKIRSGYLAVFLLMLLCYFLSLTSFIQLRKENQWLDNTRQVINELGILQTHLKDGEISWHEYLLSQQEIYLKDYEGSRDQVDSAYRVLSRFLSDRPAQEKRLEAMHRLITRKYQMLDEELASFQNNHYQISDFIRNREQHNIQMIESIGQIGDSLTIAEKRLLSLRIQRVAFYSQIVFWIIIGAGLVSGLLIVYSLVTFNMESRAKKNATIQAESYHDQLEKRILELANANRELLELRSLERFTGTGRIARVIAHEIRNPLTNIDLSLGQLEKDSLDDGDKKKFMEIIARNSRRINELISELLSATKFTDLQYEEIRVDDLMEESLREAIDRARLNHIHIERNYAREEIWLNVDRSRMKIALLNIMVNAMEAMKDGEGILNLGTARVNDECTITIRDNGKGMDAETLAKVFDPYFTSKSNGSGLGMTNTENIVLNHKGKIEVFSEEGRGTTFVISLKIRKKEQATSV